MENRKWSTGAEDGHLAKRLMNDWNPRGGAELYKNDDGLSRWTVWYNHETDKSRKTIVLDGEKFSDLQSFYKEIDFLFRKNPDREIRHNLSTLNDLLRGGSRVMKFQEPINLIWKNSAKSMKDLGLKSRNTWAVGESFFEILIGMISEHKHIELSLE
jgi:hypothetical protein